MMNTVLSIISSISITIVAVFLVVLVFMANKKEKHIMIISYRIKNAIGHRYRSFCKGDEIETFNELLDDIKQDCLGSEGIITNVSVL